MEPPWSGAIYLSVPRFGTSMVRGNVPWCSMCLRLMAEGGVLLAGSHEGIWPPTLVSRVLAQIGYWPNPAEAAVTPNISMQEILKEAHEPLCLPTSL